LGPFRIHDNGVRTFVPPCFCYELRDANNNTFQTVSDVSYKGKTSQDASPDSADRYHPPFALDSTLYYGVIEPYDVTVGDIKAEGLRFIVTEEE
jgi:hypothetical protein